jgi:hypothetical protein
VVANYGYTRRTVFGICALLKPVTFGKELVALDPANKPPLVAVVLFASSRLRAEKGSQEDPLIFLRGLTLSGTKLTLRDFGHEIIKRIFT